MSTNALDAQGVVLKIGDGASPEVFTEIQEVKSIAGPGGSAADIDVTDLSSTGKEFKVGLMDEGEVSFDIHYIPSETTHASLRTARAARTLKNFQIVFTDTPATTWTFAAYVKGFQMSSAVDQVITATVTLRVTGSITEA